MNCPVCNASDLPDGTKKCPHCESDLEVFQMTRRIAKSRTNLVSVTVIIAVLLLAMLGYWLWNGPGRSQSEKKASLEAVTENENLKAELQKVKGEHSELLQEVSELKKAASTVKAEAKKRTKEYVVREGETLFSIARKVYGNGFRYEDLARDNGLDDPAHIFSGQKLIIYY